MSDVEKIFEAAERLKNQQAKLFKNERARLSDVLPLVNAAINAGLALDVAYQVLSVDGGLNLTFEGFRKARLALIKKRSGDASLSSVEPEPAKQSEPPSESRAEGAGEEGEIEAVEKSDKQKYEDYQAKLEAKGFLRDHSERSKNRK